MVFLSGKLDFNVSPRYFMLEAFEYCSLGIICVKFVGAQVLLILPSETRKGFMFTVVNYSHNVHPSGSMLRRPSTEYIYIYEIVLFLENQISKKSRREALNLILKILGFLKKFIEPGNPVLTNLETYNILKI